MSPQARRGLRIDDPVLGDACHVAQLGSPDGSSGRLCDIALNEIHPNEDSDEIEKVVLVAGERDIDRARPSMEMAREEQRNEKCR